MQKSTKVVLIVLGGAGLLFVGALGACVVGIAYIASDPPGVQVEVDGPSFVTMDEEFELTVTVENQREDEPFELSSIDLADVYLDGFMLLNTIPRARSSEHIPIDNTRSFAFNRSLPPGQSAQFTFRLKPVKAGIYRGDIDVVEGMRFTSVLAQTAVQDD